MNRLYDLLTYVVAVCLYFKREGNRMRILEEKEDKTREGKRGVWRELRNDGFHRLCSVLYIIRVIRSSRMSWNGHVTQKKDIKMYTNV